MHGCNQKRIDKFIKVTDDWYPCYDGNTVKMSMFVTYIPKHKWCFVRIMVWGKDDFGLIMDYEDTNYDNLISKYAEWKKNIFDKITDGVNQQWFYERGFYAY